MTGEPLSKVLFEALTNNGVNVEEVDASDWPSTNLYLPGKARIKVRLKGNTNPTIFFDWVVTEDTLSLMDQFQLLIEKIEAAQRTIATEQKKTRHIEVE